MIREALTVSPQQVDPLSWIVRFWVSLAFSLLALAYGLLTAISGAGASQRPWLDLIAVGFIFLACLYVQAATRPLQPSFRPISAVVPLTLAGAGLTVSTLSVMSSRLPVQHWWLPIGLGIVLATLGPFSTALQVLLYGTILSGVTGVAAWVAFIGPDQPWPPLSTIVIACSAVVVATLATAVFCFAVVLETRRRLAGVVSADGSDDDEHERAVRHAEITTLARLGSRVAPFLEAVAEAGEVTDQDRAVAGQLARRLRTDLVTQVDRSWLDQIAHAGQILVVDPDHRADGMNSSQRSALSGLLQTVLNDPATDRGSLFVELRGQADGSTAVAISLDLDLPEGRRAMLLAPYYLALTTSVGELSWDPVHDLLRFRVPPPPRP